ncbi:MAG: hypothetical protein ACLU5I_01150 [Alistipes finegoldii]
MLKAKISPKKQRSDIVRMNLAGETRVNKVISPEDIVKARKVVEDLYGREDQKYIIDIIRHARAGGVQPRSSRT